MKGNKKKLSKVLLSSTLLLTMFFTTMPTSVFAAENVASPKAGDVDVEISKTNFPDDVFRGYVQKFDTDKDGSLSIAERNAVTEINVIWIENYGKQISDLKGIEHFTALASLNCKNNLLKSLDLSKNTALNTLNCSFNNIKNLNLTGNLALTDLDCSVNPLVSLDVTKNVELNQLSCFNSSLDNLDVTKNIKLTILNCLNKPKDYITPELEYIKAYSNKLTSLDVSKNTALTDLDCGSNKLTNLDVSNNKELAQFNCRGNALTSLDVSNNIKLTGLWCSSNSLTSLDVSTNTSLESLDCSSNQLTSLDVNKNTSLDGLICNDNQLTSLDVSKNPKLFNFDCSGNQLTSLDVSQNETLIALICPSNKLTTLDVRNNTLLKFLFCNDNQLTSLDVSKNPELFKFDCSKQNRTLTYDKNKGYLLSAYDTGFVKGNASKFVGATYNDGTLTGVKFKTPITYDYNTGCKIAGLETQMDVTLTFDEKKDKPTITVGSGSNHQVNSSNDMAFTCSGKLEDLNGVYVDGKLVAENNYTLKSGSTILTLKSSYLDTLSVGKHILKFQYKDNVSAETDFTITTKTDETPAKPSTPNTGDTTVKPSTPNTGDTSNTMLCFGLMILSGCLAGYSLKKKKALRS